MSGRSFDGVNNVIIVDDDANLDGTNDEATFSLWINWIDASDGAYQRVMVSSNRVGPPNNGYEWASQPTGNHFFYPRVDDAWNNYNLGPDPFTDGVWQHLAVTLNYSTKSVKIYVNGNPMAFSTVNVPTFWTSLADIDDWIWGGEPNNFAGSMDEIRVQNIERTEDWLLTEFRNQNDPASFYSVSAESDHNLLPDELCPYDAPQTLNQARPVGGTYSGPGVSGGVFTPATAGAGNHTITYTYTDVNGCTGTGSEIITVNPISSPPSGTNGERCGAGTVSLQASGAGAGEDYKWYDALTGGSLLQTNGSTFITPSIGSTTTYYATIYNTTTLCESTPRTPVVATVNTLPIGTFSYAGSPYCPTDADPLPTFSGGGVAGTFSSTPGLVFISTASGQLDLSASTPATYTVTNTIAAAGGCGQVTETGSITILSGEIWTGAIDTDWNTAGNWSCLYIPTGSTSIQIPNVANKPVLSSGAMASVNNLTIDAGSSLTISGNTIQIAGTITNNGTFTASAGTIEINGSVAQTIGAGLFEDNLLMDLIINNAAGVSLTGSLSVSGILYPQSGNFASAGNLTLASDASATALIDGSGTGTVSGNITMQRYLAERFGYKYFSSPFQSASVSEYADDIDLTFWYPTIFEYDESRTTSGWVDYSNPVGILAPLSGYALNFGSTLSADTVDISGVVNNGALSVLLYNNDNTYTKGLNLVGNPYPSPIDWDAASGWTKTNIDNAIYYFKSSTIDEYGGTYSSYIGGISSDGLVSNIIPSMQGFFIHVSDGAYPVSATLGLNNSVRIIDLTHAYTKSKTAALSTKSQYPYLRLSVKFDDDPLSADPFVIYFHPFATEGYDSDRDALKLLNTDYSVPNIYSTLPDDKILSINSLPATVEFPHRIPLGLKTNRSGNLIIKLQDIYYDFTNYTVWLYDAGTGANQRLLSDNDYRVTMDAGKYNMRFF